MEMSIVHPMNALLGPVRRSSQRSRWRQMVAALALIALVFPSLGALPWIAASFVPGAVIIGPARARGR